MKTGKILVLAGPTAVGKTPLAIAWARQFDGEIINADSRQIYRHMDIGTAKPTPAEQAAAPHHMLDVVNPDETFTLAEFQDAAYDLIADIHERGRLPILAGGTGMYITAIMEGWRIPDVAPNPNLRAELEALSNDELAARLQALDPESAASIDPNNPRRLVRALEVCLISGQRFSDLRRKQPPAYDALYFALMLPREELYARADARVEKMIAAGWVEEVRRLSGLGFTGPAMSALGYPQIRDYLDGKLTLEEATTAIQMATHKFIRRQYTWLRGHDPGWQWIEPPEPSTAQIEAWLGLAQ